MQYFLVFKRKKGDVIMRKTNLFIAIGAGLMTFGATYNYLTGNYAWASIQAKILVGLGIVLFLSIRNNKGRDKWCSR